MSDNKALAEQAKERGNEAYKAGDHNKAVKEFSQAIELDSSNAVYWSNRSMVYATMENYEAALTDGMKCIEIKPDWPKSYSRAGLALFKLDRIDEAIQAYEQGLAKVPNDASLQQALDQAKKAKAEASANPLGQMFGPAMWTRLSMNPRTRPLLNDAGFVQKLKLLSTNPNLLNAYLQDPQMKAALPVILGMSADFGPDTEDNDADMGNTETPYSAPSSSPYTNTSTSNNNNNSSSSSSNNNNNNNNSSSNNSNNYKSNSTSSYKKPEPEPEPEMTEEEKQKVQSKKAAQAEKDRGNEFFGQRKWDEAMNHYNKAVELDATDITYYSNRAAVHFQRGDYESCIKECEEGIRVGQENMADYKLVAKAYLRMGMAYHKLNRFDECIHSYEKSLLEENNEKTKKMLKDVQAEKRKKEEASYIDPALSEQHKEKGNQAFKDGKWVDAIQEYSEALRRNPENYRVLSNRALCYTKLMEWQKALGDCDACLAKDPKFVKAYIRKARVHQFLKQFHKALEAVDKGLAIEPDNVELKQARAEITVAISMENSSGQVDPQRQQEAMKDPEIVSILRDPVINNVLQDMQNNPQSAKKALNNPDVRAKIEKLIASGVLQVK